MRILVHNCLFSDRKASYIHSTSYAVGLGNGMAYTFGFVYSRGAISGSKTIV